MYNFLKFFGMKTVLLFLIILNMVFTGTSQEEGYDHYLLKASLPKWAIKGISNLEANRVYRISDFINPFYFEGDFNGDDNLDIAVAIVEKKTNKTGILFYHGETHHHFIIGAGQKFDDYCDHFNWMDIWKVFRGPTMQEMYIDKEKNIPTRREIQLTSPAIYAVKFESSAKLIYWDGQSYQCAHVGD